MFDSTNFHIKDEYRFMTQAYYQHCYDPSKGIRLTINTDDGRILLYYEKGYRTTYKKLIKTQSYFDALMIYDELIELDCYKKVDFGEFYKYHSYK